MMQPFASISGQLIIFSPHIMGAMSAGISGHVGKADAKDTRRNKVNMVAAGLS